MTEQQIKDRLHKEGTFPTLEELQTAHPDFTETECKTLLQMLETWVLLNNEHPAYGEAVKRAEKWNI